MSESAEFEALVSVLREHQTVATGLGEWACKCTPMMWRPLQNKSRHIARAVFAAGFTISLTPPATTEAARTIPPRGLPFAPPENEEPTCPTCGQALFTHGIVGRCTPPAMTEADS